MNLRKFAYILMTFSFILIISGSVSSFLISLSNDKKRTYKRMDDVSNSFEVFSTNVTAFENLREQLYTTTFNNVYYDTMYQQDNEVKNNLSNYEHLVDELKNNTTNLNKLCDNVYYPNSSVNKKCAEYKTIYEQVINYFVSDINSYNDNVTKYNNYQASQGSNLTIDKYLTTKKFIDYDNDDKFAGKEE